MSEGIVLVKYLPEPDWLHRRVDEGVLRASMNVYEGSYQGIGIMPLSTPMSASTDVCPLPMGCDPGELLDWVGGRISHINPLAWIAFVVLDLEFGQRQAYADAVAALDLDARGVQWAGAHIIGPGPYNAVVELVSDDQAAFLESLLLVTDQPGIRAADVLRVRPEDTRGMGSASAAKRGAALRKPAKRTRRG